jgi:hypothetical protein
MTHSSTATTLDVDSGLWEGKVWNFYSHRGREAQSAPPPAIGERRAGAKPLVRAQGQRRWPFDLDQSLGCKF